MPYRPMRDALLVALKLPGGEGRRSKRSQAIADKLVELAMKGDFYAIREIFDRVDEMVEDRSPRSAKRGR